MLYTISFEKGYHTTKAQRTYLYKFAEIIDVSEIKVVPLGGNLHAMPCTDFKIGKFRVMGDQNNISSWYIAPEDGVYTSEIDWIQYMVDRIIECEDEDGELVLDIM